jgi:hypothetical protein
MPPLAHLAGRNQYAPINGKKKIRLKTAIVKDWWQNGGAKLLLSRDFLHRIQLGIEGKRSRLGGRRKFRFHSLPVLFKRFSNLVAQAGEAC